MERSIIIGKRKISNNDPVFIISEIGANHNNDFELAKKLIDLSIAAGVDAVKFQSYKAETLYSRHTPPIVKEDGSLGPVPFDLIKSIEMPYEWHKKLKDYCDVKNIIFLSSPFDLEAVDSLEDVGVAAYKIASSEIGDPILLKYIARTMKPIILSTGKATLKEVEQAVSWITSEGNSKIILLQCVASYPAVYEAMNLNVIKTLKSNFDCIVGLSDHNTENITAVAAVALGAKVIEKHFTLDKQMRGPDHAFALEPEQLNELVDFIRKTELSLGEGTKQLHPSEEQGRMRGNRSVHTRRAMKRGEFVTMDDIIIKRPAFGVSGSLYEEILGKKLKNDIDDDMWITWSDVE